MQKVTAIINQKMRELVESDRLKGMDFQTIDQLIEWISLFLLEFHKDFDWSVWIDKKESQSFEDDPSKSTMIEEEGGERQVDEGEESLRSFVIGNALKKWSLLTDETIVREKTDESLYDLLESMMKPLEDSGEMMDDGSVTDSLLFAEIVGALGGNPLLWPREQLDSMSLSPDQWNVAVDSILKAILAVSSRSVSQISQLFSSFDPPFIFLS